MITDREWSWITAGTLLAVTAGGHRYRGRAVEQAGGGGWRVELDGGGIYECGRAGDRRIEYLLGPPYAVTSNPAGRL